MLRQDGDGQRFVNTTKPGLLFVAVVRGIGEQQTLSEEPVKQFKMRKEELFFTTSSSR
jgi:hypothetical protein